MKRFPLNLSIIFILVHSFTVITRAQSIEGVTRLTLDKCIEYALSHNENIKISDIDVDIARAQAGEYLAQGLPQLEGAATFNKNFIIRRTFVPANIFDPSAPEGEVIELQFGTPYDGNVGLNFSQMIFDGSYFVGLKAARTLTGLNRKELTRSKIDVVENVVKAYYAVLVNNENLELVRANYNRLDTLLEETRIMYENGFAEKIDLNRTLVEFNNVKSQLNSTRIRANISLYLLKFQMGMYLEQEIEIMEEFSDLDLDVADLLNMEMNYSQRIEHSILRTNVELSELDMKNNIVQYLPRIDLIASWGLNAGVQDAEKLVQWGERRIWPDYQVAGISIYMPIFDGLMKSKKIQQNKLKIRQLNYQRSLLEKNIFVEVHEKRGQLRASLDRLKNQEENMELAREVYDHTKLKYQEGLGSNLEVIEADNAFKQAQTNYFNAMYDALVAKIELEKALGIIDSRYKF